jgi:hypothetical protein
MNKNIFFGIISIDESIPVSNVEPFDDTRHSFFQNFFVRSRSITSSSVVICICSYGANRFLGIAGLILGFNLGFHLLDGVFDGSFS